MIYLRASTLDSFRKCIETDYGDEDRLAESIKAGQANSDGNWQSKAGTAFHAVLASPESHAVKIIDEFADGTVVPRDEYRSEKYSFYGEHVRAALEHVGPGLCEVRAAKLIPTRHGTVALSGQADRVQGLMVRDAKCTWSPIDPEQYELSLQWRSYLLIHGCGGFVYDIFRFDEPKDGGENGGLCELKEMYSFRMWNYPNLTTDVIEWLNRFLDWAEARGLLADLKRRPTYG